MPSRTTHYSAYPYPLAQGHAGGLPSVFLKETRTHRDLVLLTTDESDHVLGNARIRVARPQHVDRDELFRHWFGIGCWQWLHPEAHTDHGGDPGAVRFMLGLDDATPEVGLDDLLRYCAAAAAPKEHAERFNRAFDPLLQEVAAGSVVNWQDFMFVPSILAHAERLRANGVRQTLHLHTSIPSSLVHSSFGMDVLRAMSLVDSVYLHTDVYIARARHQLEHARLRAPALRRFDLGIDRNALDAGDASTDGLTESQLAFVTEVLRTQETVPHRFMDIDRVDPGKGTATVIKAVSRFLDGRRAAGQSAQVLQRSYRFFFLQPFLHAPYDAQNLQTGRYGRYINRLFDELVERHPGVVFVSDAIQGRGRALIPTLLRGTHGLSGGAQDGLNLAIMENAYVNRDRDTMIICGDGAGIAIHARALGHCEHAFLPRAGDIDAFARAIADTVELQGRRAWLLRDRKAPLVDHIMRRNDSVLVDD
jgi:hypothetical protein